MGVSGEIYIGGAGVARGYLNRPELTAERFVPDPFSDQAGARLYRTGDVGRFLADGNIEFLGRNDHQVKIRGFRIELGEIEAQLSAHPQVREAVVLAREDVPGDKRLVAYYTVRDGQAAVETEELRAHLQQHLPAYMVPAAFVRLESLPLTPNGKLDRNALPAPEGDAYAHREYEAPQGEVEIALAGIWSELLQVERIGRQDNFFELGGHSLLVVQAVERMRQQGLHSDVRTLFDAPTLWQLAAQVRGESFGVAVPPNGIPKDCEQITPQMLQPLLQFEQSHIDQITACIPGGARNVQDIYPLAPLQEGILFHHLMGAQGDAYITPVLLSFDGKDRLDRYVAALQQVIDRHDILRTGILWEGLPEPVQVVQRQARLPVEQLHFEQGDVAEQLRAHFDPRRHRLDVRQAPLHRVFIAFDGQRQRWLMLWAVHHLVTDHATLEVLHAEIHAHLQGEQDQLKAPVPFRNFVAQARLGLSAQAHEQFFRQMLGDIEEPTAPFGLLDVQGDGSGIIEARRGLDADLSRRLRTQARLAGVSPASVHHLAWGQVLARLTGQDQVVFGTVLFGRMQSGEGSERGMGLFINTLPLRLSIDERAVRSAVRATHEQLGALLRHEHASLAQAQRCSGVPHPAPLFTTLFNYRHSRPQRQSDRTSHSTPTTAA